MTDSLFRKRKLADSIIPRGTVGTDTPKFITSSPYLAESSMLGHAKLKICIHLPQSGWHLDVITTPCHMIDVIT